MSDETIIDSSEPLDNTQYERFAQLVVSGIDTAEAYRKLNPDCTEESSWNGSWRWTRKDEVKNRIKWLQKQSAAKAVLTMDERRQFMARVVRAKLHELDFDKDGDLIQEIVRTEGTEKKAGIEKFKLPGKRECIMDDAKLAGELLEKQEVTQKGDPDAPIVVQLPQICYTPRKKKP